MSGESENSGQYDDSEVEEASSDEDYGNGITEDEYVEDDEFSDDSVYGLIRDSSEAPVRKRLRVGLKRDRTDRLSSLPESVIVHILSFLPILDSIRTGVLSKRWQFLWTCVPTLCFNYARIIGEFDSWAPVTSDFVEIVDKTLVLCDGSAKNFGVTFPYRKRFASNCSLWARFASRNGVQKFELDFELSESFVDERGDDDDIYTLPHFIYTNSKFRELRFSLCRIEPQSTVAWNSLKKLSIGYVKLSDDVIQRILAGTPVLEVLELYYFKGINSLNIGNSSVKSLILRESWTNDSSEELFSLEISAPNVRSLKISGHFLKCRLLDMKSLVEADLFNIDLESYPDDEDDGHHYDEDLVNQAKSLLDSLAHVKTLTLGTWVIKGLAMLHTKHVSPLLLKCECLKMNTEVLKTHPLGLAVLLRYFPLLQTLILNTSSSFDNRWNCMVGYGNTLRRVEEEFSASPIPFSGLRTVKFLDFWTYHKPAFEFVQILLKNAKMLQKMIVHTGTRKDFCRNPDKLFKAAQKLLSFPRTSPDAQLLVYE